jgi:mRNA-degrading endonuclease toxin of MazEF toxin-antitoxin module
MCEAVRSVSRDYLESRLGKLVPSTLDEVIERLGRLLAIEIPESS